MWILFAAIIATGAVEPVWTAVYAHSRDYNNLYTVIPRVGAAPGKPNEALKLQWTSAETCVTGAPLSYSQSYHPVAWDFAHVSNTTQLLDTLTDERDWTYVSTDYWYMLYASQLMMPTEFARCTPLLRSPKYLASSNDGGGGGLMLTIDQYVNDRLINISSRASHLPWFEPVTPVPLNPHTTKIDLGAYQIPTSGPLSSNTDDRRRWNEQRLFTNSLNSEIMMPIGPGTSATDADLHATLIWSWLGLGPRSPIWGMWPLITLTMRRAADNEPPAGRLQFGTVDTFSITDTVEYADTFVRCPAQFPLDCCLPAHVLELSAGERVMTVCVLPGSVDLWATGATFMTLSRVSSLHLVLNSTIYADQSLDWSTGTYGMHEDGGSGSNIHNCVAGHTVSWFDNQQPLNCREDTLYIGSTLLRLVVAIINPRTALAANFSTFSEPSQRVLAKCSSGGGPTEMCMAIARLYTYDAKNINIYVLFIPLLFFYAQFVFWIRRLTLERFSARLYAAGASDDDSNEQLTCWQRSPASINTVSWIIEAAGSIYMVIILIVNLQDLSLDIRIRAIQQSTPLWNEERNASMLVIILQCTYGLCLAGYWFTFVLSVWPRFGLYRNIFAHLKTTPPSSDAATAAASSPDSKSGDITDQGVYSAFVAAMRPPTHNASSNSSSNVSVIKNRPDEMEFQRAMRDLCLHPLYAFSLWLVLLEDAIDYMFDIVVVLMACGICVYTITRWLSLLKIPAFFKRYMWYATYSAATCVAVLFCSATVLLAPILNRVIQFISAETLTYALVIIVESTFVLAIRLYIDDLRAAFEVLSDVGTAPSTSTSAFVSQYAWTAYGRRKAI